MQGTQVRALVREDPTCHRAAKPVRHNCWACALEPTSHNYWAHVPQLLKPACLEPMLHNRRGHCNEKPTHHNKDWPPLAATRESPWAATIQHSQERRKEGKEKRKERQNIRPVWVPTDLSPALHGLWYAHTEGGSWSQEGLWGGRSYEAEKQQKGKY